MRPYSQVPGLIAVTAMPMRNAVGTSLMVVAVLGLTTAISYAFSGSVDWSLSAFLVGGGIFGAVAGIALGRRMAAYKGMLERLFALIVIGVGCYVSFMARL